MASPIQDAIDALDAVLGALTQADDDIRTAIDNAASGANLGIVDGVDADIAQALVDGVNSASATLKAQTGRWHNDATAPILKARARLEQALAALGT